MSDEIEELKLKAARLAVEREELALAREKELLRERNGRRETVHTVQRRAARTVSAAADAGSRTGKAVLGYFGRLLLLLLLWGIGVFAVSVYLYSKEVPSGVDATFGYVTGYALAASAYYAPWLCLLLAFFNISEEQWGSVLVLCGILIIGVNKYADPSVMPVAPPFNEHIRPNLLRYAQAPEISYEERRRRYDIYFKGRCSDTSSPQSQQSAFNRELSLVESRYPALNPDSREFAEKVEAQVANRLEDYKRSGNTPCMALRLAADEIMLGLNM